MAFNDEQVVIVDVFTTRDVIIESCDINYEMATVVVRGKMTTDKYGVYALRIVYEENINKALMVISPQYIISPDQKNRPFTAVFNNAQKILEDKAPKIIEVYLRGKPETIRYNVTFPDRIKVEDLILGIRVPFDSFPNENMIKEQRKDEETEKKRIEEEDRKRQEEKFREKEERERRLVRTDNYDILYN
jgi:hypothetical protein